MLNLKSYLPGKFHSCYGCGTVIQFDAETAEKVQRLTKELEIAMQEVIEDVQKPR